MEVHHHAPCHLCRWGQEVSGVGEGGEVWRIQTSVARVRADETVGTQWGWVDGEGGVGLLMVIEIRAVGKDR